MQQFEFHQRVAHLTSVARQAAEEIDTMITELVRLTDLHDKTANPTRDFLDLKGQALADAIVQMDQIRTQVSETTKHLAIIV